MTGCREDWDQVAESRADEIAWIKQNEDDDCRATSTKREAVD